MCIRDSPAQLVLGLGGVGVALRDITGAARVDDVGNLFAAGLAEGVDDVQHAVTVAGAQVADEQDVYKRQPGGGTPPVGRCWDCSIRS